ncbi:MAG: dynamin family protein [Anaerolineae bacterium]
MALNILEGPLAALRESEIDVTTDIAALLAEMGAHEDSKRLMDVARDLREAFFLVVIIGEFNSGKSTFVNALLGDELLPMGITPTTEVIEMIRYGSEVSHRPISQDDSLQVWVHPGTGAEGVAIVDTPGTGSVFQRHETTAKEFLHRSDLVIFLVNAKRAFAETERIYLETAKNYGKKIILVVNQVDLLQPSEQQTVKRFIEQQVKELLGLQPLMFMVSARESLRAAKNPQIDPGNVDAVRGHLRGVFAEAPPAKQKLLAQLDSVTKVLDRYAGDIQSKADLVKADTAKVREVQQELQQQSLGLNAQLTEARAEVDKVFVGLRQRGLSFIDENLSIRKIGGTARQERLQAEFQDVVLGRALRDITEATNGYINAVIDQSRSYWRGVIERLNQLRDLLAQEVTGLDSYAYSEQRENLEEAIRIAEAELKSYSTGRLVEDLRQDFEVSMNGFRNSTFAALGGLVALLGAIAVNGPLIGAGAAPWALPLFVIAAPVAALGSLAALRYYRHITGDIKNDFNKRVDRLRDAYHTALDELTQKERNRLAQYGAQVLTPIFSRLEVLETRYSDQRTKFENFQRRLATLRKGIQDI